MSYDVVVIGGGPAGLSAALNVRARGRSVLVVTNPPEENPLWKAERVDNYLGMPGLSGAELLEQLRQRGLKLAVVSNKPDETTRTLAARFFPGLAALGQRDSIPSKPAPEMVWSAMEQLGVDAQHALYVGDSEVDVEMAHRAGLPLAAVAWGFRGRALLEQAGARCIVDTVPELLAVATE